MILYCIEPAIPTSIQPKKWKHPQLVMPKKGMTAPPLSTHNKKAWKHPSTSCPKGHDGAPLMIPTTKSIRRKRRSKVRISPDWGLVGPRSGEIHLARSLFLRIQYREREPTRENRQVFFRDLWRRVVDDVRTLIETHNTEFNVFAKTVLGIQW